MAVISMREAMRTGEKVFVGDSPVCITAPGRMGMLVGAGDTLTKLVQIVVMSDVFGEAEDNINTKTTRLIPHAVAVIRESQIFADVEFDMFESEQAFEDAVFNIMVGLIRLLEIGKVDTLKESDKMQAVSQQVGMRQTQNAMEQQQGLAGKMPRRF